MNSDGLITEGCRGIKSGLSFQMAEVEKGELICWSRSRTNLASNPKTACAPVRSQTLSDSKYLLLKCQFLLLVICCYINGIKQQKH